MTTTISGLPDTPANRLFERVLGEQTADVIEVAVIAIAAALESSPEEHYLDATYDELADAIRLLAKIAGRPELLDYVA